MDHLNLPYPMFITTEAEKELLRKCELYLVEHPEFELGLCGVIRYCRNELHFTEMNVVNTLRGKIHEKLDDNYLEYAFRNTHSHVYEGLWDKDVYIARVLVRRIWITKLLNYTGK